jgi:hypothetical protein
MIYNKISNLKGGDLKMKKECYSLQDKEKRFSSRKTFLKLLREAERFARAENPIGLQFKDRSCSKREK